MDEPHPHSKEHEERKKCKKVGEIPFPDKGYKMCVYRCKDWPGDTIRRAFKLTSICPEETDWVEGDYDI